MGGVKVNNALICLEKLHFTYAGVDSQEEAVLSDISLEVSEGEFLAVIGPNGSGKSTLARHLNGLLLPTRGRALVNGLDTSDYNNHRAIRELVGMVLQNPENQFVASIVEEDVAFGPENLGLSPQEIKIRVGEALSMVGLESYRHKPPHFLSGGQKQLLAIAGVLAMRSKCLVLDEPTAMLDPAGRRKVLESVRELNRNSGLTVILITNLMEETVLADRIIVLNRGCLVSEGTPEMVFGDPEGLEGFGLELPPAIRMAARLRKLGALVPEGITDFEGLVSYLCKQSWR